MYVSRNHPERGVRLAACCVDGHATFVPLGGLKITMQPTWCGERTAVCAVSVSGYTASIAPLLPLPLPHRTAPSPPSIAAVRFCINCACAVADALL